MSPLPRTIADIQILERDPDQHHTKFAATPAEVGQDEHAALPAFPLIFELSVGRVGDLLATHITINEQQLDVKWDTTVADGSVFATITSPSTQLLTIPDARGVSHVVDVSLSGYIPVDRRRQPRREPADTQHLSLLVRSVDERAVQHFELDVVCRSTARFQRLQKLYRVRDMRPVASDNRHVQPLSLDTVVDTDPVAAQTRGQHRAAALNIEAEIESLLLLEAQAEELATQIAAKKQCLSKGLRDHRENVSLAHLLRQCDGVVCAAKVIAQHICDKMGVETTPSFDYVQVQDSSAQQLMQLDEGKQDDVSALPVATTSRLTDSVMASKGHFHLPTSGTAIRQSMEIVYPQSLLYRVLGVISVACGLTALFGFIRRKCMSARGLVDELAEREERRNARAYRRAARRVDMRKRWDAFLSSVNCFSARGDEPRGENYEEKRALILQDAFLEPDLEAAEKGEVMEAEIRELRYAHEIISSLVRVDENRHDRAPAPANDPPRPLVSLATGRSRASTATLPSYTSELLPDYQSRVSAVSTTIASSGSSTNGSSDYSPTSSSGGGDDIFTAAAAGSTPRSMSPDGSTGTRQSRMTEMSSIIEISPRASEETLRTLQRSSMAWSRISRDHNDL